MTQLPLAISAIYIALCGVLLMVLAFRVSLARRRQGVAVLDGGNNDVLKAVRAHGNAAEYVPVCLVMLAALELNGLAPFGLHLLGAGLFLMRLAHGIGMTLTTGPHPLRFVGIIGTWAIMLVSAGLLIWQVVAGS